MSSHQNQKQTLNSARGQQELRKRLSETIEPLTELNQRERELFDLVITSKPVDCWQNSQILTAGTLAQVFNRIEMLTVKLNEEGPTIQNANGTTISNPLIRSISDCVSTTLQIQKLIGLSPSQLGEVGLTKATALKKERQISNANDKVDKPKTKISLLAK